MGTGVAADHMAAGVQFSNLILGQKCRLPDVVSRYEEVPAPPVVFEKRRNQHGACTAIIKSEQQRVGSDRPESGVDDRNFASSGSPGNCFEVALKFGTCKLIDIGVPAGEAAAMKPAGHNHVVVEQRNRFHRCFAAVFQCRYWASQGCPYAADLLPLTSTGNCTAFVNLPNLVLLGI